MAEGHRLRRLQMREAWHQRCRVLFRLAHEFELQACELLVEVIGGIAEVKTEVGCDLVIARPSRMQSAGSRPDQLLQPRFHSHVDIFVLTAVLEAAFGNFLPDRFQSV